MRKARRKESTIMKISPSNYLDWQIKKGEIRSLKKKIFFRGVDPGSIISKSIAIVGSRRMTKYGGDVVDKFVSTLVAEGVTTISGFMYGVDTEVHQRTVEYEGKTISVFGCGLNVVYPSENERLYKEILENGGSVVSEYTQDAKPHLWKFPQRNKIIAALSSLGVLVIEAADKSGSLITAEFGSKMGKKVFAVPGPITSSVSAGCNELIKKGEAILVTDPEDILGKVQKPTRTSVASKLSDLEFAIYKTLENEPQNIDEISLHLGADIVEIGKTISLMSIKGLLSESGGKYYIGK